SWSGIGSLIPPKVVDLPGGPRAGPAPGGGGLGITGHGARAYTMCNDGVPGRTHDPASVPNANAAHPKPSAALPILDGWTSLNPAAPMVRNRSGWFPCFASGRSCRHRRRCIGRRCAARSRVFMNAVDRVSPISSVRPAVNRSPFVRLRELLGAWSPGQPAISLAVGEPQHAVPSFVGPVLAAHLEEFGRY